ncbi:hypothetical protein GBA52_021181 [Prunus armeniaca]|nr:hypothetical protein GBA52_021181 [Prunus armeniaca]
MEDPAIEFPKEGLLLEVKSQPVYPGDAILVALEANCVVCKLFLGYKIEKLRDRSIKLPKEGQFFLDVQKLDTYRESGNCL